jgi:hypothetical protein
MSPKYSIWIPRVLNLPPEFFSEDFEILPDIFSWFEIFIWTFLDLF